MHLRSVNHKIHRLQKIDGTEKSTSGYWMASIFRFCGRTNAFDLNFS